MELSELKASAQVVSLALKTPFRSISHRELLIFEGPAGFSEWSPFLEYEAVEAAQWLKASLEWATLRPTPIRTAVNFNASLPAVMPALVEEILSSFGELNTIKIKIAETGQRLSDDLDRINEVRKLFPNAKLRLDANGKLSITQALALAEIILKSEINLEYLEQPVATIAEMASLKNQLAQRSLPVKIAADESIRKVSDPMEAYLASACDVMVVKWQPLAGFANILELESKTKMPMVVSSALESSIGLNASVWLAASLESEFDAGLGTSALFAQDIAQVSNQPQELAPNQELLERNLVSEDRKMWWLQRLEQSYRVIEGELL